MWTWIVFAIVLVFLASFAYAAWSGAPWVPTWRADIERLEKLLALKPGQTFMELGCGDGRVVLDVAKNAGVTGIGVELSLAQFMAAQIRRMLMRVPDTYIIFGNVFHANIQNADAVYLFLMPDAYEKLRPKFEAELKPGAKVVSYVWPIPRWEPTKIDHVEGKQNLFLYVR